MAKKDIVGTGASSANVFNAIATASTKDTQDTQNIQGTKSTKGGKSTKATKEKPEYYRFNLKMPLAYKDYLQAAAYKQSSAKKTVTITEYICELIRRDMEENAGKDK